MYGGEWLKTRDRLLRKSVFLPFEKESVGKGGGGALSLKKKD